MSAIKFNVKLSDFHAAHKRRDHGEQGTVDDINDYRIILETMGDILGDEMIEKGKVTFPLSSWIFKIKKRKSDYVDRKLSKEVREQVIGFNDHSDGFRCTIHALISESLSKKKVFYYFRANRDLKRIKLRDAIKADKNIIYNYEIVEKLHSKVLV